MMFRINCNFAVKLIVILVASLLLLTTATDAAANGGSPGSGSAVSSYAGSGNSGGLGGLFTGLLNQEVLLGDSPSGCVQSAQYPHISRHALPERRVNGEIRAKCNSRVPRMYHSATLFKTQSLRWVQVGQSILDRANIDEGRAYANAPCERLAYRVVGTGFIVDIDGETYIAATASPPIYNPCDM